MVARLYQFLHIIVTLGCLVWRFVLFKFPYYWLLYVMSGNDILTLISSYKTEPLINSGDLNVFGKWILKILEHAMSEVCQNASCWGRAACKEGCSHCLLSLMFWQTSIIDWHCYYQIFFLSIFIKSLFRVNPIRCCTWIWDSRRTAKEDIKTLYNVNFLQS